jgi:PAS domain-containing protein
MKPPLASRNPVARPEGEPTELRVLIAERPGGKLATLAASFPVDLPVDFEVEDHLPVVASLAAQNAFDAVVIGESLFGRQVPGETVRSLVESSRMTPILVLGEHVPEFHEGIETGALRIVRLPRLTPTLLLREIRQTLEMHVAAFPEAEPERRIRCLARIFDSMLERMPYAVAVTDAEGRVRFLNAPARSFWANPDRDVLGTRLLRRPEEGRAEILTVGPPDAQVEVAPVPIEWLGERYFLTSIRRVGGRNGGRP